MKKSKFRLSIILPICLFIYLCVMAYIGRATLAAGNYLKYFGVIGIGLIIIVLLAYLLRRKEQMRTEDEAEYGTYADEEKKKSQSN